MDRNSGIGLAVVFLVLAFLFWENTVAVSGPPTTQNAEKQQFKASYGTPLIDGREEEDAWQQAAWLPLDQVWIGETPAPADFSGRYKILWDENNLYVLAEITDDTLVDFRSDR